MDKQPQEQAPLPSVRGGAYNVRLQQFLRADFRMNWCHAMKGKRLGFRCFRPLVIPAQPDRR